MASVASLAARPESEDPTGNTTSLKIAARAATFSAFAPLFTGQEEKVVTFQTMTKAEVMSTQLAQKRPPDTTLLNAVDS